MGGCLGGEKKATDTVQAPPPRYVPSVTQGPRLKPLMHPPTALLLSPLQLTTFSSLTHSLLNSALKILLIGAASTRCQAGHSDNILTPRPANPALLPTSLSRQLLTYCIFLLSIATRWWKNVSVIPTDGSSFFVSPHSLLLLATK